MKIKEIIIIYLLATVLFFIIDLTWLGVIAEGFYKNQLGGLLRSSTNWYAALIFYFIYVAGILYFAVIPGILNHNSKKAALNGAILGFLCYSTFELTAFALLNNWPFAIVIPDIIWGIVLTSTVSYFTHLIYLKLIK